MFWLSYWNIYKTTWKRMLWFTLRFINGSKFTVYVTKFVSSKLLHILFWNKINQTRSKCRNYNNTLNVYYLLPVVLQLYKHLTAGSFFFFQLHSNVIRDVMFLHESWPWCKGQNALLTVAIDGTAKVFYGIDDRPWLFIWGVKGVMSIPLSSAEAPWVSR